MIGNRRRRRSRKSDALKLKVFPVVSNCHPEKTAGQAALETAQGGDVASIITALTRQGEPLAACGVFFYFAKMLMNIDSNCAITREKNISGRV